jgi:hypothetical protein
MNAQTQPKNGGVRPGAGRPPGSRSVRVVMREKLIAAYVDALGGADRVNLIVMQDIERVVGLTLLAAQLRDEVHLGRGTVRELTSVEATLGKALRRLDLPAQNAAPAVRTLAAYLASKQAASDEAEG